MASEKHLEPSLQIISHIENTPRTPPRLTVYVLLSCMVASIAGFIYGYDLVIAGGIGIMDGFLEKFYPKVMEEKKIAKQDVYCKYNNDVFQLFSSSLYLGALLATFIASFVTRRYGRKTTMLIAGLLFILGTLLSALAYNLPMLLSGRFLIGIGLGCSNQATPLYISEIAPQQLRGGCFYIFGLSVGCGSLIGNVVNYLAEKVHPWGWRISLGVIGVPSLFFTLSSLFLLETPISLIQQGHYNKAKHVLAKIRGSTEVDTEYQDLIDARNIQNIESSIKILWTRKNYVPQLVIGMALPFFQQVVGSDVILFYGVFIFKTAGFNNGTTLYSAIIIGACSLTTTSIALLLVDQIGRRKLLLGASTIFLIVMMVVALIFINGWRNSTPTKELGKAEGIGLVVAFCVFVATFGSSLAPLAWLIPTEIYASQVRSAGFGVTIFVNMLFKFIIAQTFLSMLCTLRYGTFLLSSGFSLLLIISVAFFLPETKGRPLHAMQEIWKSHWFWKRFFSKDHSNVVI